jgi:hypothetical protein
MYPCSLDIIEVDLAHTERNREVVIYSGSDVQHVDNVYDCFFIVVAMDFRDATKEVSFIASIVSETEILLTMPSLPFGLFHDSVMRNEHLKKIKLHHPQLQLSQDIVINHLCDKVGRSVKRLLLHFPDDVTLSNVFNAAHPSVKCILNQPRRRLVLSKLCHAAIVSWSGRLPILTQIVAPQLRLLSLHLLMYWLRILQVC